MYVIVILNSNLLTLFSKRRPFNFLTAKVKETHGHIGTKNVEY